MTDDSAPGPTRVLHVVGSPKGESSASTRIARAFLDAVLDADGDCELTTVDVWTADLPPFGREMAIAKLAPIVGEQRTPEQEAGWRVVELFVADFARYDKVVISTPMWNFGLPSALKHYIDLLVQPGLSFGVDASGEHVGLLEDRPVQLVLTRSSPMAEGSPEDFLLPYLKHVLGFIGLRDVRAIIVEGTTLPQPARDSLIERHCEEARVAAARF